VPTLTTGATRGLLRSFASPFSAHDEYRLRHFTDAASRASSSSSSSTGGMEGHRDRAAGQGEDVAAAQKKWMVALHGSHPRAQEELDALRAFAHTKLPLHPDDGTPRAVLPGACVILQPSSFPQGGCGGGWCI
jgi:hypothetical protein